MVTTEDDGKSLALISLYVRILAIISLSKLLQEMTILV